MRWFKPNLRSSFFALFASGQPPVASESLPQVSVEDIRDAMLALVGSHEDKRSVQAGRRIRAALDAVGLWYLRADLMAILASRDGEALAREKLRTISEMFEHLLPRGLKSRPSPLALSSRFDDPGTLPS